MRRGLRLALVCALFACASAPPPDRSELSGTLVLVPHAGLPRSGASSYGDRRLRGAKLVDYSHPGFAVVYLSRPGDGDPVTPDRAEEARLDIREGDVRPHFEPQEFAVALGTTIAIRNLDRSTHVVSCPEASLLTSVEPGQSLRFVAERAGEHRIFLADTAGTFAHLFSAPGPFAVPSSSGRFAIRDLRPGAWTLRAWHPRFPPASREIVLDAGKRLDVEIALGVGRPAESDR